MLILFFILDGGQAIVLLAIIKNVVLSTKNDLFIALKMANIPRILICRIRKLTISFVGENVNPMPSDNAALRIVQNRRATIQWTTTKSQQQIHIGEQLFFPKI